VTTAKEIAPLNMSPVDYGLVFAMLALLVWGVLKSRAHMQGVSDFLAAGRTAGRYTICVSQGIAMLGAITIVAHFEMYYNSGFPMQWWELLMSVVILFVTVSGWVVYRFRQTRALTMAQFFEMRYSKRFRIFAGTIAWVSGIVNYGIYPAVSARFFIYFCGLPHSFDCLGAEVSTFVALMILLLGTALFFVFVGGQIAVIFTDFIQGVFVSIVFIVTVIFFLNKFDYHTILDTLSSRPADSSYLNPFKTGKAEHFDFGYFVIGTIGFIYNMLSWQGAQGYNASASSAHEARMAQILSNWRQLPQYMFYLFVAVCAYTVMNSPEFAASAETVRATLAAEPNSAVQGQLTVPVVLSVLLPVGLMGAIAAVMLGAFITTNDTYLHSWGSILVQDVILPLRKKPLTPRQHIWALRLSILFVALFAFVFSLIFHQTEHILLFFAITGAIYAGGSGSVIIGGLYWKKGTTAAAWGAMITGSLLSVGGILCQQFWGDWFGAKFPIDGQVFWLLAILSSVVTYVLVSLLYAKEDFDMDRLLNRGKAAVESVSVRVMRGLKSLLGEGKEFTRTDRWICRATYAWVFAWFVVFLIGTIWNLTCDVSDGAWMKYWYFFVIVRIVAAVLVIIWFTIGGVADIGKMFSRLRGMKRDHGDDGSVE